MHDFRSNTAATDGSDHAVDLVQGLRSIRLEPPRRVGALDIHPLVLVGDVGSPWLLLHEALALKTLEVFETAEGTVNQLHARNVSDRPILILEGESIAGAKQNRLITVDLLLAPHSTVIVHVGCVEQGRWDAAEKPFIAAAMAADPMLRRSAQVGSSPDGQPNQMRLWRTIKRKLHRSGTSSASSDYFALSARYQQGVARVTSVLTCREGQVGILATQAGRLVGFDLLGHPRNWRAVSDRFSQSYVLGSLHEDDEANGHPVRSAQAWLETIAHAKPLALATTGLGSRFSLDDEALVGGGLWHAGRVAHLSAFGFHRPATAGGWVTG